MSKGLFEYAAQNPAQAAPQVQKDIESTADYYRQQQEQHERAEQLKEIIAQQIQQGNDPQYILYAAIEAIALLTHDAEWQQEQHERLNSIYADLAQQSFIADNEAIAARRREQTQQEYNSKLRGQLCKQLRGYRKIAAGLEDALKALDELNPPDIENLIL